MNQPKDAKTAAIELAKWMLHRLSLGAAAFAFNQQQLAEKIKEARDFCEAAGVAASVLDDKGHAIYDLFYTFRLFDVESPIIDNRAKVLGSTDYASVLLFFKNVKQKWNEALVNFASHYPTEMDLPEGYTYRIEDTDAKVEDWIAKLPGHLTGATGVITGIDQGASSNAPHPLIFGDMTFRPELSLVPPVTKDGKSWSGEIRPQQDTGYIRLLSPNEAQIDEAIRDMMSQVLNPETRSPSQMVQSMRLTDVTLFEPGFDFRRQLICMAAWVQNVAVMRGGHLVLENFLHGDKAIVSFPFPRIMNAELVIREAAPHGFVHVAITRNPHPNTTKFQDQWHYHINGKFAQLSEDVTANVAASAITSHAIFAV